MKKLKLKSIRQAVRSVGTLKQVFLIISLFHFFIFLSCAKMGSPDGGWYDDDPPKVVRSVPADQSVNIQSQKITIYFDEFIKLEDATNKVIISPPQLEMAEIKASGKKVVVELQDSLKENTTVYKIGAYKNRISNRTSTRPGVIRRFFMILHLDSGQYGGSDRWTA